MKPKSAIQKGKVFENWIAGQIEEMGLGMAGRTPGSGSGKRKGDIMANLPFLIEAKNQKTYHLPEWIEQAKKQAEQGNWDRDKWALVIRKPRSPTEYPEAYAIIDLHEFLKLLKKDKEPMIKEPDREMKYRLKNLAMAVKSVEKYLPD